MIVMPASRLSQGPLVMLDADLSRKSRQWATRDNPAHTYFRGHANDGAVLLSTNTQRRVNTADYCAGWFDGVGHAVRDARVRIR